MVMLWYILLGLLTIGLSATFLVIDFFSWAPKARSERSLYMKIYSYCMVPASGFLGALPAALFNPGDIGRIRIIVIWPILWALPFALSHIKSRLTPPSWTPDVRRWRRWLFGVLWISTWIIEGGLFFYMLHLWP